MIKKNVIKNIIMLYGMTIAKMVFPLIILPYLTRVLTVESYGTVAYVKTVMQYMQLFIDFGFMLSGTKAIVDTNNDLEKIGFVAGNILVSRIILVICAAIPLGILIWALPILNAAVLYTVLSFIGVALTIFLFDYVFRGIEKMQVITVRFILMKSISTVLTFLFVKSDEDILWIPILDILGTIFAIVLVAIELKKLKIHLNFSSLENSIGYLKTSAIYFLSDFSTTAFGALNTLLIGVFLDSMQVAFWSVCMQLIGAVQSLYSPITNGIYPDMVRNKDLRLVKRMLWLFMPIILVGSIFTFFIAEIALTIVGGTQYIQATELLRYLIPILIFSFPAMLLGWPTLGAISKARQVTISTIVAASFQIIGIVVLVVIGQFNLITLAILRGSTELMLFSLRLLYCFKYRKCFAINVL